ncbi:hypothetical protein ABZ345_45090 [Lentzea sp. NPDC005914]|uniref:hypothetical protein n=1 Tax=Lentzea sp. NPDC005914 TaxID=3154572 RepID=UPI0033C6C967
MRAASADPDGFRLLFRHAVREPEFRDVVYRMRGESAAVAQREGDETIPEGPWRGGRRSWCRRSRSRP